MDTIFSTENINFITINISLINEYLTMICNEEVQMNLYNKLKSFTYEDELNWINETLNDNTELNFSMMKKDTNEYIGNISIMGINKRNEIGISITPNMWNKGFGTEAILGFMNYLYFTYGISDFMLIVYSFNNRAIKVYTNIGFTPYKTVELDNGVYDIYMKKKLK